MKVKIYVALLIWPPEQCCDLDVLSVGEGQGVAEGGGNSNIKKKTKKNHPEAWGKYPILGGGNSNIFFNFHPEKLGKMNPF